MTSAGFDDHNGSQCGLCGEAIPQQCRSILACADHPLFYSCGFSVLKIPLNRSPESPGDVRLKQVLFCMRCFHSLCQDAVALLTDEQHDTWVRFNRYTASVKPDEKGVRHFRFTLKNGKETAT